MQKNDLYVIWILREFLLCFYVLWNRPIWNQQSEIESKTCGRDIERLVEMEKKTKQESYRQKENRVSATKWRKSNYRCGTDKQPWKMYSERVRERDWEERGKGRRVRRIKTAHALKSLSLTAAPTSYIDRQDALCNIQHHLHVRQTQISNFQIWF